MRGELEEVRYLEMNLHLHERLWQQHQDRIFDEEEWEPWERRFRDEVVTAEMFPAVWTTERDYVQDEFARYVDAIVADVLAHRAAAAVWSGGDSCLLGRRRQPRPSGSEPLQRCDPTLRGQLVVSRPIS